MGATMTTISALTKEIYEGTLREQLKDEVTTLTRVQKTSEGITSDVGGKYVVFPIEVSRNAGVGARLENEALPTAGNQGTKAARVGLRYLYGSVRMSGPTFELAKTNEQAFVSALDLEMNGLKSDLATDCNRQVYGNGQGIMAVVQTGVTAATFAIVHANWLNSQVGAVVDIYDTTGVTQKASARTITGVVSSDTLGSSTVTISGANVTVVAGDIIVRTGNIGTSDGVTQREWTGLGNIVGGSAVGYPAALYNVTDSVWTPNQYFNAGTPRALSEGLMTQAADGVYKRGGKTTVVFTTLGVRRSYANLLTQQRRYTNTQEFAGGFKGLAFTTDRGDIPLAVDTHCPPQTMYGLNEDQLKWYREADWEFMDRDGSMWQRTAGGGFDSYDATMYQYSELGTHRRNSHFVLGDLIES